MADLPYKWMPASTAQYDGTSWGLFSQTPYAGTSTNSANPENSFNGEWAPEGYDAGWYHDNGMMNWALRDDKGNIINTWSGPMRDSLNSDDYALMAALGTAGYGIAGGFGGLAAGGAGAGAGAAGAAEGAGSIFGTTFGGAGALGDAGLLTGGVAGGGGLTSGAAFGGAGGASAASSGLFGLSNNTLANLGQMGVGLYAQNKAQNAMTDANNAQLGLQREMWQQNRADNQPLLDLRNGTLPQINALMKDPSSITQDPGYQFGLNQGQSQIDNSAAARGGYYSGAQMKASQRYGQDYAGTKLDQSLNRLMGVAGLGQVGGANNQNNNAQFSQQQGNALMTGGNIRGSGYIGSANVLNGGIENIYNDNQQQWWNNQRNPFGGP